MNPSVKVDTSDFSRKFQEYASVNKRSMADLANAKLLQLSFEAQRQTPKAEPQRIAELQKKPWWPKYVAKRIKRGDGYSRNTRARGKVNVTYQRGRSNYRNFAKTFSDKIIAARKKAVTYEKSGYLPAIRRLRAIVKDKAIARGAIVGIRQWGADKGSVITAQPGDHVFAEVTNAAKGIEKVGTAPMERAKEIVMQDMDVYIERKMQEDIDRVFR